LLQAVETSNEASTTAAQTSLIQAKLRADFLHAVEEKNEAQSKWQECQQSLQLVQTDLDHYKAKNQQLVHDKWQLERDYRAAQAVYGSLQGSVNADVEYYKRKVRKSFR
jgi:Tfp pilus assembly protein PilV